VRTLRIALALLLIAPVAVRAQAVTIAIFPLSAFALGQDGKSQEALGTALRDMLITELAQNPKLKPIDRNQVDELIRSRQLSLSGKIKDDDALQLGQLLGAQYFIGGGMTIAGGTARMDLRLTDAETGLISDTFKGGGKQDEMLAIVEKVAAQFAGKVQVKQRVADVVVPIPSVFAYTRGLDYEQRGDRKKAAEMFQTAIRIFPDNAAAKAALDRVK
jgi:TolB-like protein